MPTAHVQSTEQINSKMKDRINKDDASDNDNGELCCYDYIIIFVQNLLYLYKMFLKKSIYNVIVTIMEREEQIFYVK